MSKTWSYTRVPRSRRSRAAAGRAGCRDPWKLTRYPGAPGRFLRRAISHLRTARTRRKYAIYHFPGSCAAAWAALGGATCEESRPVWAARRASPVRGGIRAGVRGPGRRDRGPRSALGGARYVSGRARAAGRGKLNAQKKPRGGTPGRRVQRWAGQLWVYPSDSIPSHIPHHCTMMQSSKGRRCAVRRHARYEGLG